MRTVLIQTDDRLLADRASTLADKVQVAPVVVSLPNPQEWLKIGHQSGRFSQNLYTSPGFPSRSRTDTSGQVQAVAGMRPLVLNKMLNEDATERLLISVAHSDRELQANPQMLWYVLALSVLVSIAVAAILSYRLAGVALRPIRQARTVNQAGRFASTSPAKSGGGQGCEGATIRAQVQQFKIPRLEKRQGVKNSSSTVYKVMS